MNMKKLTILHLQGNRISGEIPTMNLAIDASDSVTEDRILPSAYISDCGMPSDLTDGLLCSECTMCCECPLFTSWSFLPQSISSLTCGIFLQAIPIESVIQRRSFWGRNMDLRIIHSSVCWCLHVFLSWHVLCSSLRLLLTGTRLQWTQHNLSYLINSYRRMKIMTMPWVPWEMPRSINSSSSGPR